MFAGVLACCALGLVVSGPISSAPIEPGPPDARPSSSATPGASESTDSVTVVRVSADSSREPVDASSPEAETRFGPRTTVPIAVEPDVVAVEPHDRSTGSNTRQSVTAESDDVGPWERVVGEGARLCAAFEAEARSHLLQGTAATANIDDKTWRRRARECPHGEWVLRAAVEAEMRTNFALPDASPTPADVAELEDTLRRSRRRVLRWVATIGRERARVGAPLLPRDTYLAACAHAGLGQRRAARVALADAVRRGGATAAETHRLSALLALFGGDLDRAAIDARRASFAGTEHDAIVSQYVRAIVLDRLGDGPEAQRLMADARRRDRSGRSALLWLESLLPMHERLYLRALDHQVEHTRNAALVFWRVYLGHDAPTDAERQLAQRHLAALAPVPEPVIDDRSGDDASTGSPASEVETAPDPAADPSSSADPDAELGPDLAPE